MEKRLNITVVLRGTENEIEKVKARFAALSTSEEVRSLYIKEVGKVSHIWQYAKEKQKIEKARWDKEVRKV
ncbi:hypothetical protein KAW18_11005 [candidate division WOR-3 bacterium]|nr:hypothetical protein [candidate division WOR-3 bacterium]